MRPRKKKYCGERMEHCSDIWLRDCAALKAHLEQLSGPLEVELGCGKGTFICIMAQRRPEVNFIAIEKVPDVLVTAMERAEELGLSNLRFFCGDAKSMEEYFAPESLDRLYINFCDPWHKRKHFKRRLTYRDFLRKYKRVLKTGGEIQFKTDNEPLFRFSVPEFEAAGFVTRSRTDDLHALGDPENIVTEYEANFSAKGFAIHRLIVGKPAENKEHTEVEQ